MKYIYYHFHKVYDDKGVSIGDGNGTVTINKPIDSIEDIYTIQNDLLKVGKSSYFRVNSVLITWYTLLRTEEE